MSLSTQSVSNECAKNKEDISFMLSTSNFCLWNTLWFFWQGIVPIYRSVFWCNCVLCMSSAEHFSSCFSRGRASLVKALFILQSHNSQAASCEDAVLCLKYSVRYQKVRCITFLWHMERSKSQIWMFIILRVKACFYFETGIKSFFKAAWENI